MSSVIHNSIELVRDFIKIGIDINAKNKDKGRIKIKKEYIRKNSIIDCN